MIKKKSTPPIEPQPNEAIDSVIKYRGERLKRLRHLANLTRKQLCERGNLNPSTLKGWEIGRHGGLTENGAKKIIPLLLEEGVICELDWLMHEKGIEPTVVTHYKKTQSNLIKSIDNHLSNQQIEVIESELAFFLSRHTDSTYYIINDHSMQPFYKSGDIVAGIITTPLLTKQHIEKHIIVCMKTGKKWVGTLTDITSSICFFHFLNNKQKDVIKKINPKEIKWIAPIIWHRSVN